MKLPSTNLNQLALMGLFAFLSTVLYSEAVHALGHQPDTPCPCVVEGSCKPQGPWGYTQTQWRRWPGDTIERPADVQAEEEEIRGSLPGSELPPPEKEGLRGPEPQENRRKLKKERTGAAAGALPEDAVQAPFPAVEPPPVLPPAIEDGLPGVGDINPPAALEPVQPDEAAQPVAEEPEEAEELGDDLFDPFSQIDSPLEQEPQPARSTTQAPKLQKTNGPPPLPSSLKKFSRLMQPKTPVYTRSKRSDRFQSAAVALAR